jgi:hypothetical protein
MEKENLNQLFEQQFKFKLNESVKHRGDKTEGFSSDMGLLVLNRALVEEADDYGNINYSKQYACRMIRFSGSGQISFFNEKELYALDEYTEQSVKDKIRRDEIHHEMNESKNEVYKSFGVKMGTKVYLTKDGAADKSKVYVVAGFRQDKNGTILNLRDEAGEGATTAKTDIKSKSEFEVVTTETKEI